MGPHPERDRGIPYHRGYLLHGVPGSGKTSCLLAVASALGLDLCLLSLASPDLNEYRLRALLGHLPPRALLVVEDVDRDLAGAAAPEPGSYARGLVEGPPATRLSFATILNALDGVGTPDGLCAFLTTNHRDRLDPALIRPGRVDVALAFGPATADQARRLFLRFFPDRHDLAHEFARRAGGAGRAMAALQGHLMQFRDDPDRAAAGPIVGPDPDEPAPREHANGRLVERT